MGISIEDVIEAANTVSQTRGVRRIEVGQAAAAAETSLRESGEADAAVLGLEAALADVRAKAAALDDTEASLDALIVSAQGALVARGKKVIEIDEAVAAMAVAISEAAEAQVANTNEEAAIESLKIKANDYVKED